MHRACWASTWADPAEEIYERPFMLRSTIVFLPQWADGATPNPYVPHDATRLILSQARSRTIGRDGIPRVSSQKLKPWPVACVHFPHLCHRRVRYLVHKMCASELPRKTLALPKYGSLS